MACLGSSSVRTATHRCLLLCAVFHVLMTRLVAGQPAKPVLDLSQTIDWAPCDIFECATVRVPTEYTLLDAKSSKSSKKSDKKSKSSKSRRTLREGSTKKPKAGRVLQETTIDIALIRLPAVNRDDYRGPLFLNPGGPGGSGVDLVYTLGFNFNRMNVPSLEKYDLIGFDPRGAARSCPVFVGNCDALQEFMNTADVARDIFYINKLLGYDKLSFLGYSYGSNIGIMFSKLFPDSVNAMLIDGVVDVEKNVDCDPLTSDSNMFEFNEILEEFCRQCEESVKNACELSSSKGRGSCLERIFAVQNSLQALGDLAPVPVGIFERRVFLSMYPPAVFEIVDFVQGLEAILAGALEIPIVDGPLQQPEDRGSFALVATRCNDRCYDRNANLADFQDGIAAQYGSVGFMRNDWAFGLAAFCIRNEWRIEESESAYFGPFDVEEMSAPVMIVNPEFDPPTPLVGAQAARQLLNGSFLITVKGHLGHTAAFDNDVLDVIINEYFENPQRAKATYGDQVIPPRFLNTFDELSPPQRRLRPVDEVEVDPVKEARRKVSEAIRNASRTSFA